MSRKENLLRAKNTTASVYFRDFAKKHARLKKEIRFFIFLEGISDTDYYKTHFDTHLGRNYWYSMECNGRDNVIKLIELIRSHEEETYKNLIYSGFIDNDYYNNTENTPSKDIIYITPTYSIENFYATKNFFEDILKYEFKIDNESPYWSICINNFFERLSDYIRIMIEIDKIIRANFYQGLEKEIFDLQYKQLPLHKAFIIELSEVKLKQNYNCFKLLNIEDTSFIENKYMNQSLTVYENTNHQDIYKIIRGKFILFFIEKYLNKLRCDATINQTQSTSYCFYDINNPENPSEKILKPNPKFNISSNIMSEFSQYAEKPQCLTNFLNNLKSKVEII